ncbi:hypothetical protein CBOM_02658 [Ceraceosorus bombacis]|uniref:Uncharacterized protein n=1 Tax=Ceraceosorus bombacis TaxID=401625 RepID=A0A0P1BFK7_9BASI|nr:hypothetical protein CBOM_02658 [Ceraceosorus bombacis]
MRAFANDYRTLLRESSSAPTATLTPSSSAHASSLATRRSLALSLANRRRFDPSDSLYEGASARPTCSPFAPAPSHLVTSSGAFAPLKPHGRSTHPIAPLPSSTNTAMRAAVGTALSRRVQRTKDPLPVYDAAGVERVFHGAPASREHFKPLVDVENALSAAIRSLLADSAREAACAAALASQDEGAMEGRQEEEAVLDMQRAGALIATNPLAAQQAITASSHVLNSANEERPKEGVLVHTWDWTARDYKDVDALPGKRIRGT